MLAAETFGLKATTVQYVKPAGRMRHTRKFRSAQLGFRCSISSPHTDNLSLF